MELLEILGYLSALLIGIVLGLIGSGGSILTVPVLVYLFGLNVIVATAYSLFIVGITALVGAFRNIQKKLVDFKTAIIFAIPAFIAVYLTRRYIINVIPETLFVINGYEITKEIGIMLLFALLMLVAAVAMMFEIVKTKDDSRVKKLNYPLIIVEGLVIGSLTGLVGAGGGFLIIPALVLLAKLPMKKAVATSLLIIAIKSLIGFIGDVETLSINWKFLFSITAMAILGIGIGIRLNRFINGEKLKKGFGIFVLIMGIYIILKEIVF